MDGFRSENIRRLVLDVLKEDDIQSVVKTILGETGRIDIIVNNAGALAIGGFCSGERNVRSRFVQVPSRKQPWNKFGMPLN